MKWENLEAEALLIAAARSHQRQQHAMRLAAMLTVVGLVIGAVAIFADLLSAGAAVGILGVWCVLAWGVLRPSGAIQEVHRRFAPSLPVLLDCARQRSVESGGPVAAIRVRSLPRGPLLSACVEINSGVVRGHGIDQNWTPDPRTRIRETSGSADPDELKTLLGSVELSELCQERPLRDGVPCEAAVVWPSGEVKRWSCNLAGLQGPRGLSKFLHRLAGVTFAAWRTSQP